MKQTSTMLNNIFLIMSSHSTRGKLLNWKIEETNSGHRSTIKYLNLRKIP